MAFSGSRCHSSTENEMKKLHTLPATRSKHRAFLLLLLLMMTVSQASHIVDFFNGYADEFAQHK
jgi:hypothetical protein